MDPDVISAIKRWPDVPAAYGWLSLDSRGNWRLHPAGDAADGGPGVSITSPQILRFLARNYEHDDAGRWFFQNGPQRVFVRIDAAPLVLRAQARADVLQDHCGSLIERVDMWWLDDAGRLFARTPHGPGLIEDRDLMRVLEGFAFAGEEADRENARIDPLECFAELPVGASVRVVHPLSPAGIPFRAVACARLPDELGFVASPTAA